MEELLADGNIKKAMKDVMKNPEFKNMKKELDAQFKEFTIGTVLITTSRQVKYKMFKKENIYEQIRVYFNSEVEMRREEKLEIGPWKDKKIFICFQYNTKGNRRAKKLFNCDIGSDVIIFNNDESLTVKDFTEVEKEILKPSL